MSGILESGANSITRYLLAASIAAFVLVPLAGTLIRAARIRTATYRHMIWLHCLAGTAVLPLLWLCEPKLTLAVLPARVVEPAATNSPATIQEEPAATPPDPVPGRVRSGLPVPVLQHAEAVPTHAWALRMLPAAGWLVGFVFMLARLAVGWYRLQRICAEAAPVHPAHPAPGRRRVRLTSRIHSPACFGILRPVILLPRDIYETAGPDDLRMVLTHELAHVSRRDGCVNLFQRLVEAVLFFHPLVWLASRQLTNEREHICDNYVLAQGAAPDDYTTLLFRMVEQTLGRRRLPAVALFEGQLLARVRSLLNPRRSRQTRLPWRAAAACTAVVVAVFLACGSIRLGARPAQTDTPGARAAQQVRTVGQFKPPFTFTIKTITPEGQPQAGVKIRCLHPRAERGKALVDMTVASDASGTARFVVQDANMLTDRYFWFDVADGGFAGSGGVGISPIDHEFEWTFKTLPVQERKLRIVSEQGAGVAGAKVWIGAPDVFLHASPSAGDKDGNVTVMCPSTKLTIGVAAPGFASTIVEEVELTGPDARIIQLQPGQEIRGQVVDARNQPVPGMVVRARKEAPFHYLDEFMPQAHTAADGRFTLPHVAPGNWEVTARSEDPNRPFFVAPATASVTTGNNVGDITLAAQQGFRIKGRYITPRRTEVRLSGARRDISLSVNAPARANWREQTREDGTFDLWSLPCEGQGNIGFIGVSGFHEIVKTSQAYPFFQVVDRNLRFENVPPGTYEGFEVHFLLAGRVEGTVTDGSGQPLRDVEVVVNPPGYIQKVNQEGRFTSEAAPGADVTVTVRKGRDQVLLITEPFRLQEGEIVEKNLMVTGGAYGAGPSPVGRQMPVLASLGVDATPDALEGKRVLLCFFDMNQRPSRRFVPELAARAKALEKNNVVTFLIQAGQAEKNAVEQWLRERSVPFATGTVSGDTTRLLKDWTVQALPWLVLLDEKRALAATGFDLQELDKNLKSKSLEQLPVALDWRAKFDLVYRLEEGQILRRIAPPFILERQQYYTAENEHQASLIPRGPDRMVFHWDSRLQNWGMSFGDRGSLGSTLSLVLGLKSYEYEGQKDLLELELPGDWIIRHETPIERKLKALEQLLVGETGRNIRFEKRSVEQEVIVATGRYEFHQLPGPFRSGQVIMCTDETDHAAHEGGGGGTAGSVREFVEAVGNRVGMPVVDQTEPTGAVRIGYGHHSSSYLTRVKDPAEKAGKLKILLESLSQQTSLQFQVERRPADKWFVIEDRAGPAGTSR